MKFKIKKTILMILAACNFLWAQDIDLADGYYTQGEYEKAVDLYKKINFSKVAGNQSHEYFLSALYKLKDYSTAEKFIKSEIKQHTYNLSYKCQLAEFYEITGKADLAESEFQKLIAQYCNSDATFYELHNYFYKINKYEKVIDLINAARQTTKDNTKYETFLARTYLFLGFKDKMLDELFNYGPRAQAYNYVEMAIQDNIKDEPEIEMLEKKLYERIQNFPNETFYNEILIWHFTQKSDYFRAFIQAKALDKRQNLEGTKIFELATLAIGNADYKNSAKMFKYVMDEYPNSDLSIMARRFYIQSKEEIVRHTFPINLQDIKEILIQYETLISETGLNYKTVEALRSMAFLNAFYLDDKDKAISILENAIKSSGNNITFRDQCKLDLGDIYILKNEPWESTLLYMQVEKSEKENNLGESAKLKNARLQYFQGDFELAKELLDILKKATTREIANDAMQLSLLIDDNTGLDSTDTALKEYSAVELLIFQNKYEQAIEVLTKISAKYKTHSLADEILWLRANNYLKINKIDEAVKDLDLIVKDFKQDILADDALYLRAKITEENYKDKTQAMELYKTLLKEYPGSVFCAQARIRYRELRGDLVN